MGPSYSYPARMIRSRVGTLAKMVACCRCCKPSSYTISGTNRREAAVAAAQRVTRDDSATSRLAARALLRFIGEAARRVEAAVGRHAGLPYGGAEPEEVPMFELTSETPNGWKVAILLEELAAPTAITPDLAHQSGAKAGLVRRAESERADPDIDRS